MGQLWWLRRSETAHLDRAEDCSYSRERFFCCQVVRKHCASIVALMAREDERWAAMIDCDERRRYRSTRLAAVR
jgi:hypothetical protein